MFSSLLPKRSDVSVLLASLVLVSCSGGSDEADQIRSFSRTAEALVDAVDTVQLSTDAAANDDLAVRTLARYVPTIRKQADQLENQADGFDGSLSSAADGLAQTADELARAYEAFEASIGGNNDQQISEAAAAIGTRTDAFAAAETVWNDAVDGWRQKP